MALQTENPSVLAMIEQLTAVIKSAPMSLQDLVDRLDIHLSCIAIGVDVSTTPPHQAKKSTIVSYFCKLICNRFFIQSPHNDVHYLVAELRTKFELLLHQSTGGSSSISDGTMCAGQMLLMGFNGLFEKLYLDGHALAPKLSSINSNIPPCWRNLDHIREAKAFSVSLFHELVTVFCISINLFHCCNIYFPY